ncbi:tetratricopeptide repeat protein, partial [Arthrospira platensis SPKY2]
MQILAERENQRFEQIGAAICLGLSNCFAGRHEESIAHTSEGLRIAEEIGDHEGAALLRANLCLVHRAAGNLDQSIAYGESALPVLQRQKNRRVEGLCRNRLG